jgi:hypothetical protein
MKTIHALGLRSSLIAFLLAGSAVSQGDLFVAPGLPVDGWVYSDYLFMGTLNNSLGPITAVSISAGGDAIAVDSDGGILYAVGGWIGQILWNARGYPSLLALSYFPNNINWCAPFRDGALCFDDSTQTLLFYAHNTPTHTPASFGNPLTQFGISGTMSGMVCNGRELFFSVDVTSNDPYHIFAWDYRDPTHPVRPVAALPVGPSPRHGPSLALARDGKLLAMDDPYLYLVDPDTGTITQLMTKPTTPAFATGPFGWQIMVTYNPWTDVVAVAPTYLPVVFVMVAAPLGSPTWTMGFSALNFFPVHGGITTTAEQPFELYGMGCPNVTGRDPRLGWQGLPLQGQSFQVKLRDAEPNGLAFFWLGFSDTFWSGAGPLPFSAAAYGAPGCNLLASADVPFLAPVDSSGHASLTVPVPTNQALHGTRLFAQTASSSTANALGFAASDALIIRVR